MHTQWIPGPLFSVPFFSAHKRAWGQGYYRAGLCVMWSMECHVQTDVVRWKDVLCMSVCGIYTCTITIVTFVTVISVCVCMCARNTLTTKN